MDERIEIWNVFFEGEITILSQVGATLTIYVTIPFLRRRLEPWGDSFVLTLTGVRQAECYHLATAASRRDAQRALAAPGILRTDSIGMPVTIKTTAGPVLLDFDSIRFALDTGQDIDYQTIEQASDEYWTDWERQRT